MYVDEYSRNDWVLVVLGVGANTCAVITNDIPVFMNDGIECETVPPTGGEVAYIDIGVSCRLHLTPQQ